MTITEPCYQALLTLPSVPPEIGGLLGGHGGTIDTWYRDRSAPVLERAIYIPNLQCLNQQLARWKIRQIDFMGIFHSHPKGEQQLSQADKTYIGEIFDAMPPYISRLFFPVVIPGEKIVPFCAQKKPGGTMEIVLDTIKILHTGGYENVHEERK